MITDDLSPFFSTNDFAEACTIGAVAGYGIFSNEHQAAAAGDLAVGMQAPQLLVRASEFPAVAKGTTVVVRSVNYVVYGPPEPDGTGLVVLNLKRA